MFHSVGPNIFAITYWAGNLSSEATIVRCVGFSILKNLKGKWQDGSKFSAYHDSDLTPFVSVVVAL
jgi:hypothetical protein